MNTKKIVMMGLLIALDVVAMVFLTIKTPFIKIGFAFIPLSFTGLLFGPVLGGLGAGLGDITQYLYSGGGMFLPGITAGNVLMGVVYGLLLHKKKPSVVRVIIAVTINELIIGGVFNTYWIYLASPGKTFWALLGMRIIKALIMVPVETVIVYAMLKLSEKARFAEMLSR